MITINLLRERTATGELAQAVASLGTPAVPVEMTIETIFSVLAGLEAAVRLDESCGRRPSIRSGLRILDWCFAALDRVGEIKDRTRFVPYRVLGARVK